MWVDTPHFPPHKTALRFDVFFKNKPCGLDGVFSIHQEKKQPPVLAASQEGCHFSWSAHGQLEPGVANSRE